MRCQDDNTWILCAELFTRVVSVSDPMVSHGIYQKCKA